MKRSAKHINIKDPSTVLPWIIDCVQRHYKRHDFRDMLTRHGMKRQDYYEAKRSHDKAAFIPYCKEIAKDACERIRCRCLNLPKIRIRERIDPSSGKVRQIGNESAMQQVFDYIAVYGAMEIFNRRIVLAQVSSIKGRGQKLGVKLIRGFVDKDNRAARYAEKHGLTYSRRSTFFCKLDIRKCFPSARLEAFMRLFKRDCANEDLLWLWESLLQSHRVGGYQGFMIGALPSCWAIQYMLSFAYREAMAMHYARRGKRIKIFHKGVFFMDDLLFFGSNRSQMRRAIIKLAEFTQERLGLGVKQNWHIRRLSSARAIAEAKAASKKDSVYWHKFKLRETAIDMMGYVIHADGKATVRRRIYKKMRRVIIRYNARKTYNLKQAQRACSYKGYLNNSCHGRVEEKYGAFHALAKAAKTVSAHDKAKRQVQSCIKLYPKRN